MLYDFSVSVPGFDGKDIVDEKGEKVQLIHWLKMSAGNQIEGDPQNVEHIRKMMKVYSKLERAKEGKVELKTDTVAWLRERMVKGKLGAVILFAFEKATEGEIKDEDLDGV